MLWEVGKNCILVEKRKTRFMGFNYKYRLQSPLFLGKNIGGTRHPCEKDEPTLDHSGVGVHGKACWLIAYNMISNNVNFSIVWNDLTLFFFKVC